MCFFRKYPLQGGRAQNPPCPPRARQPLAREMGHGENSVLLGELECSSM